VIVGAAAQLSVAVAEKFTTAEHPPAGAFTVMFAGQATTGASPSLTVTVNVHCGETLAPSEAFTVTVVTPSGKDVPGLGV
jgi:hypothetical protein